LSIGGARGGNIKIKRKLEIKPLLPGHSEDKNLSETGNQFPEIEGFGIDEILNITAHLVTIFLCK
jgi:hypothetical protein